MSLKVIKKRCGRCDKMFDIPLVRESKAKRDLLTYTPCTYCKYIAFGNDEINKSGRCGRCSIPFVIIDHYAKGNCRRCYQVIFRENTTNKQ